MPDLSLGRVDLFGERDWLGGWRASSTVAREDRLLRCVSSTIAVLRSLSTVALDRSSSALSLRLLERMPRADLAPVLALFTFFLLAAGGE